MYYRLECEGGVGPFNTEQKGCCHLPAVLRLGRKMHPPKVLKQPGRPNTKSWFTETGWRKYQTEIKAVVKEVTELRLGINIITANHLDNILSEGSIQAVQKIPDKKRLTSSQCGDFEF